MTPEDQQLIGYIISDLDAIAANDEEHGAYTLMEQASGLASALRGVCYRNGIDFTTNDDEYERTQMWEMGH